MARRRRRSRGESGIGLAAVAGVALLLVALASLGGLIYFYVAVPQPPKLSADSLCPETGPLGVTVVLVDTSDDLPEPAKREVLGMLSDVVAGLPDYYKLDIRVLDIPGARSRSLFAKCNPGNGEGLSEWTANPQIARLRWLESFHKPAEDAVGNSLEAAKSKNSPIMAAIQDIAIQEFSGAQRERVPKKLIVISDMLEFTKDYSQYPAAGDLSFARYKQSPAYLKYRTDLHDAQVDLLFVNRPSAKVDTAKLPLFWRDWIAENRGRLGSMKRLQGA
jgi:hypothetical protein